MDYTEKILRQSMAVNSMREALVKFTKMPNLSENPTLKTMKEVRDIFEELSYALSINVALLEDMKVDENMPLWRNDQ